MSTINTISQRLEQFYSNTKGVLRDTKGYLAPIVSSAFKMETLDTVCKVWTGALMFGTVGSFLYKPAKPLVKRGITHWKQGEKAKAIMNFTGAAMWSAGVTYGAYQIYTDLKGRLEGISTPTKKGSTSTPGPDSTGRGTSDSSPPPTSGRTVLLWNPDSHSLDKLNKMKRPNPLNPHHP